MFLVAKILLLIISVVSAHVHFDWEPRYSAFDPAIYENALDSELCAEQLNYIRRNNTLLRLMFLESGMRLPRSILQLNNADLGNYDQCLEIQHEIPNSVIEGKYCLIRGPLNNENMALAAEALNWKDYDTDLLNEDIIKGFEDVAETKAKLKYVPLGGPISRSQPIEIFNRFPEFRMALCVPKTCTSQQGMAGLIFNLTRLGFRYEEEFCRIKDDRPWAPADYVAIVIFSIIGVLTVLSTLYDVWLTFIRKTVVSDGDQNYLADLEHPKNISTLYRSFSIYTNGKTITKISTNPNNLNCLDGIRATSMFWIVVGHTYTLLPDTYNTLYVLDWLFGWRSQWVIMAPFAVDTFFFLAGLLLVYTSVGKLNGTKLLKNLHMFYLNRLLRMFPVLATIVLLQASLFFRIFDGPLWNSVAEDVENCRNYWWSTLLYVQNFLNSTNMCIRHSWYLAIDIHCYLVSPIILYWVLGNKRKYAWAAMTCGILASLVVAATYSFVYKFPGWILAPTREGGEPNYHSFYYFNSLTRAPAFFVGMPFGYLLHSWRGKKVRIPNFVAILLWMCAALIVFLATYTTYLMKDVTTWDYWIVDDIFNSFSRPVWCLMVGWVIIACHHGYSGPINWFLCLDVWKLPSRVSYALYLFHFQLQFNIQGAARQPIFFSDAYAMYQVIAQITVFYGIAFVATLVIDAPFSVLIRLVFGSGPKKPSKEVTAKEG